MSMSKVTVLVGMVLSPRIVRPRDKPTTEPDAIVTIATPVNRPASMWLMDADRAAHMPLDPDDTGTRPWRVASWIVASLALFVILLMATLMLASWLTMDRDLVYPEREYFALLHSVLLGGSLLVAVPLAGLALGPVRLIRPAILACVPFLLVAAASYVLVEDVRSGHVFETDHALPEIFVPVALALVGTTEVGVRLAATNVGRRAWAGVSLAAAGVLLALIAGSIQKAVAGLGGMYQLDSPASFVILAVAAGYALLTLAHAVRGLSDA